MDACHLAFLGGGAPALTRVTDTREEPLRAMLLGDLAGLRRFLIAEHKGGYLWRL